MRRTLPIRSTFIALAALMAAGAVHANSGSDAMFRSLDRNADGQITRAEAREATAERFARMDVNSDGTVSPSERWGSRRVQRFQSMDANGDGQVTRAEMEAAVRDRVQTRFSRMDTDGNGALTLEEVQSNSNRSARRGPMTLQDLDARVMRMFDRADRNGDGVVTSDEAQWMRGNGQRN